MNKNTITFLLSIIVLNFVFFACSKSGKEESKEIQKIDTVYSKFIVFKKDKPKKDEMTYDGKKTGHYINAQQILCFVIQDIDLSKANVMADFYKDYYATWAKTNDNFATVQLYFFKKDLVNIPKFCDLAESNKLSDKEYGEVEKQFFGNIFYVYSDSKYMGTLK